VAVDWDWVYCHVIRLTGWTWEYVDECVTIPQVKALIAYSKENPSADQILAARYGIGQKTGTQQDLEEQVAAIKGMR